jgi:hypothetical protein
MIHVVDLSTAESAYLTLLEAKDKPRAVAADLVCALRSKTQNSGKQLHEVEIVQADAWLAICALSKSLEGTSNNCHRSSGAPNLPTNDSALFSFRFCAVHPKDLRDSQLRQLFEVPFDTDYESTSEVWSRAISRTEESRNLLD